MRQAFSDILTVRIFRISKIDAYDDFIKHCKKEYKRSREPFVLHFKNEIR